MDFIKLIPRSKKENKDVLVLADQLCKMVKAGPFTKESSAPEAAQLFLDVIYKYNGPLA